MKNLHEFTLNNGYRIPSLGIGVFTLTSKEAYDAIRAALDDGIRHIDTANAYFNEVAVGKAILDSGVKREDIFLTTKLWPSVYYRGYRAIEESLERLGLDYVDLLLLHQPSGDYLTAYQAIEEGVKRGTVRSIGLSNFDGVNESKYDEVLSKATILPQVVQVEAHPYFPQHELKKKLAKTGTLLEAWYPLGHGNPSLLKEPIFVELGKKYKKSTAQIILRWHLQEGNIIFPASRNREHIKANHDIFDFELTDEEMKRIATLDCHKRYYYASKEMLDAWGKKDSFDFSKQA